MFNSSTRIFILFGSAMVFFYIAIEIVFLRLQWMKAYTTGLLLCMGGLSVVFALCMLMRPNKLIRTIVTIVLLVSPLGLSVLGVLGRLDGGLCLMIGMFMLGLQAGALILDKTGSGLVIFSRK